MLGSHGKETRRGSFTLMLTTRSLLEATAPDQSHYGQAAEEKAMDLDDALLPTGSIEDEMDVNVRAALSPFAPLPLLADPASVARLKPQSPPLDLECSVAPSLQPHSVRVRG